MVGAGSWSEADASVLRDHAARAIERLAQMVVRDLRGEFDSALTAERVPAIRLRARTGNVSSWLLLGEHPEYFVVVPFVNDQPLRAMIIALDRGAVQVVP